MFRSEEKNGFPLSYESLPFGLVEKIAFGADTAFFVGGHVGGAVGQRSLAFHQHCSAASRLERLRGGALQDFSGLITNGVAGMVASLSAG